MKKLIFLLLPLFCTSSLFSQFGRTSIIEGKLEVYNTTYDESIYIGRKVGFNTPDGNIGYSNTIVGTEAGGSLNSGYRNAIFGFKAGHGSFQGFGNSFFGGYSGKNIYNGSGNICIGVTSGPTIDVSNRLYIDNIETDKPLIYGEMDNDVVNIFGKFEVKNSDTGTPILTVDETTTNVILFSGKLGIGIDPSSFKLNVNGNLRVATTATKATAGSWLGNSDARLKKDIESLDKKEILEKVLAMQGVSFHWNDDKTGFERPVGSQIGFIAQDLEKIWPSKVNEDSQGYLQTAYGDYDPILVEAIKAQQDEIEELESKVNGLEEDLREIKKLLKQLN